MEQRVVMDIPGDEPRALDLFEQRRERAGGSDPRVVGDMALSGLEVGRWLDRRGPRLTRER